MEIGYHEITAAVFLGVNSVLDIKRKRIWLLSAAAAAAAGLVFGINDGWSISTELLGMAPGLILVLISLFSHGTVGMGDGIAAAAAGILIGPVAALEMCGAGSIFAAAAAGILWLRKRNGKAEMPFVPFLLAGLLVTFFAG